MPGAADVAYEAIRRAVASGEYAPGSWLREEHLAARAAEGSGNRPLASVMPALIQIPLARKG